LKTSQDVAMSEQFRCDIVQQRDKSWCKPFFLIIGCQKCGSSSIFNLLTQHPKVRAPPRKELLYFQQNSQPPSDKQLFKNHYLFGGRETSANCDAMPCFSPEGVETYFRMFDEQVEPLPGTSAAEEITGEFSATYFECVCCPQQFKTFLPNTRLVVQLREPFSRAVSRFKEQIAFHNKDVGSNWAAFKIPRFEQLKACLANADTAETRAICAVTDNIFGWSLHSVFLQQFIDAGYNSQNLQVLYLDGLAEDGNEHMAKIEHFLSLPPHQYDKVDTLYNAHDHYGWGNSDRFFKNSEDADVKRFYSKDVDTLIAMCKRFGWAEPPTIWTQFLNNDLRSEGSVRYFENLEKLEQY